MQRATKKESGYIKAPKRSLWPAEGKGIRCGTCVFYGAKTKTEGGCSKVKGKLHPQACCNLWSATGHVNINFACGKDLEELF
jgi:hypothetical protein